MSLLNSLQGVTASVINRFGMTVIVARDAQEGYDPATGMTTSGIRRFATRAVIETIKKDSQNGAVQAGDFKLIIPASGEVLTGDRITFGATTATVYQVVGIPLNDGNVGYEAYARA